MSVRGERVERIVYRDREVDREDARSEAPRRTYTTVKRYQVPDSVRSAFQTGEDEVKEDRQIVIRRERREPSPPREDIQYRVTERTREREPAREEVDYRITERIREREREREREPISPQRRDISYRVIERDSDFDRSSGPRSEFRRSERDRETVRAPSPPQPEPERVREFRFERERDFSPPREREWERRREQPYDIEKYSKSTEYFSQPQPQPIIIREAAPQPIIIREERREPIVIREERREPQYEFIEREEVREDTRSLVRREEPPPPAAPSIRAPSVHATSVHSTHHTAVEPSVKAPEEENYFYERRVIERDRAPRRRDDSYDDRKSEVRPRDSASQYSSDDSYEYVRREKTYDDDRKSRSRSHSPRHRRHLAEGAIAGIGAAEILRHHKKSQGENVGGIGGRGKSAFAGAAVGALGAEAVSRVRSYSKRRQSRSRSRSSSCESKRDRRGKGKRRSRSRSKSLSRAQQLGGLAAIAAVGALAGYAMKNKGNKETVIVNNEPPRRSRSRRRRASVDSYYTDDRTVLSDAGGKAQNPEHRNMRMAQAGLASAAAAGIFDRVRSKSRGGKGRSKSRVRQAIPVMASGLGGAALAGLYEKNKAGKEAKKDAIIQDELGRGRRRRSRSRSRSVPAPYPADDRYVDDRPMIAYGHEPVHTGGPERDYYSDEEPGMYRRRGGSSGSSPDTRRRSQSRGHSRGRHLAETGAAAGAAAVAAHEVGRRRERSRQRDEAMRHDDYDYGHDQEPMYSPQPQPEGYLPQAQGSYPPGQQQSSYPGGHYFPPPPTGEYAHARDAAPAEQAGYPAYNPADYAQAAPGGQQHYQQQPYGPYGDSDANLGAPYPGNDTFAGDPRYTATPDPAAHHNNRGRDPHNPADVSAPNLQAANAAPAEEENADGISTPRPRERSQSRVRFNLDANTYQSPETSRKNDTGEGRHSDTESSNDRKHRRRRRQQEGGNEEQQQRGRGGGGVHGHRDPSGLMHDKYDRPPESDSDGTVDLPERFDEQGNRKAGAEHDPLADGLNRILGDVGFADILGRLGGAGQEGGDDGGRSGRRRHRR